MKSIQWTLFLFLFAAFACEKEEETLATTAFDFNFETNAEGWESVFADYPFDTTGFYELEYEWTQLPQPLDTTQNAMMIAGSNRSDDLFMAIKKEVGNLPPNMDFEVLFDIELASIYPTNAIGIGGPPAEAVYMKVGVTQEEPQSSLNASDFFEMNIDKGNQSQSGSQMNVIGHVGVADTTTVYTLIERSNVNKPFRFRTDDSGKAWLIIGTDSGFEGKTRLYYNKIDVLFRERAN